MLLSGDSRPTGGQALRPSADPRSSFPGPGAVALAFSSQRPLPTMLVALRRRPAFLILNQTTSGITSRQTCVSSFPLKCFSV